jgi:hypothetical protein
VADTSSSDEVVSTESGAAAPVEPTKAPKRGRRRIRTILATLLIVVASILAPIAGITVFVRNQLLNTNRYISNITPITHNPAIVASMSTAVTNQLFTRVNVEDQLKSALPPRADFIAPQLTNALKTQTEQVTTKIIGSNQFNTIWIGMQQRVHRTLVKVLVGDASGTLTTKNGAIVLDLKQLATNVIHELDQKGVHVFDKIPVDKLNPQIVLIKSQGLAGARTVTRALNHLALVLPVLTLVLYLGAIGISPRRRRAVMWSGLGLAIAMAVLGIILGLTRSYLVSAAGQQLSPTAAGDLFDTLLRYLKTGLRILFAIGIVAAFIAWLTGPSRPAVAIRRGLARAWNWLVGGNRWLADNGGVVQGVLVAAAAVLLVLLTPGWVWSLVIVAVTVLLVLVVRLSASRGKAAAPDAVAAAG